MELSCPGLVVCALALFRHFADRQAVRLITEQIVRGDVRLNLVNPTLGSRTPSWLFATSEMFGEVML